MTVPTNEVTGEEVIVVGEEVVVGLDEFLNEMTAAAEQVETPKVEDVTIRPTFDEGQKKEEVTDNATAEDDSTFITEEELDQLETEMLSIIDEMSGELEKSQEELRLESEAKAKLEEDHKIEIEAKNKELEEKNQELQGIEGLWSKIQENPVIGKLAMDVIEGKEVSLPKIVEEKLNEELLTVPTIDGGDTIHIPEQPKGLQDVFNETQTDSYNL